jgi:hypothetical protein
LGVADPADGGAGRRVATVPRLQDCRPRSVFEAGGLGSSLAATNRSRAAPQFFEVFAEAPLRDGHWTMEGAWKTRKRAFGS